MSRLIKTGNAAIFDYSDQDVDNPQFKLDEKGTLWITNCMAEIFGKQVRAMRSFSFGEALKGYKIFQDYMIPQHILDEAGITHESKFIVLGINKEL